MDSDKKDNAPIIHENVPLDKIIYLHVEAN
jgi:hypothetical protein